jgi:DNA polymerase IV
MIAHVDADSFFASVLVRKDPRLKGKPVLALGMGGGCVIAATYEAKAKGVKTGMPLREALKLVPDAVRIPSDFRETGLASSQIESILGGRCPVIEQMSIDEWYLDLTSVVGGMPDDLYGWMGETQKEVIRKTDLSVSVGIGPTKLLAKMAGEYRKPAGLTFVRPDGKYVDHAYALPIDRFLQDRPAAAIPGVGRKRMVDVELQGWTTAWDIATADSETLVRLFGRPGTEMRRELLGDSVFPVSNEDTPPKSVSRCRSFRATRNTDEVLGHVMRHLEYTVLKMRRQQLSCSIISIWVRDAQFVHHENAVRLPQAADTEDEILPHVRRCFDALLEKGHAYTQAGLALSDLKPGGGKQYSLFTDPKLVEKEERMQSALDELHARFGRDSITRGRSLRVGSGTKKDLDMPIMGSSD